MEKTSECKLKDLEIELRQPIMNQIGDEQVLICYRTEYFMVWVLLLTEKQVVLAKAAILRNRFNSLNYRIEMPQIEFISLEEIVEATQTRSGEYNLQSVLIIDRAGKTLEGFFADDSSSTRFLDFLSNARVKSIPAVVSKNLPSFSDRLSELLDLREKGLITEEEYLQKRTGIIDQL